MIDQTNAECTNCNKRFAIVRVAYLNYSCGICDTGFDIEFDTDKAARLKHEEEQRKFEYDNAQYTMCFLIAPTCVNIVLQGPRIHVVEMKNKLIELYENGPVPSTP